MKKRVIQFCAISVVLLVISVTDLYAVSKLVLPNIFSDHMVLQRNVPVLIWGTTSPGRTVIVAFADKKKSAQADSGGRWEISLDKLDASGPFMLTVSDGESTICYKDVIVGEVWLGSGQSNMEWAVDGHPKHSGTECDQATKLMVGNGDHPMIRISAITRDHLKTPDGGWVTMSKEIRPLLPATMSCMAIRLQKELNVPIGIIVRCVSSSPSGAWLDRKVYDTDPNIVAQVTSYRKNVYPELLKQHQDAIKKGKKSRAPARPGYELQSWFSTDIDSRGIHYDRFIAPITPYTIRGIVWDQGESWTGVAEVKQIDIMRALVKSWRQAWRQDDLPFLYVRKNQYPSDFQEQMKAIQSVMVDNRGLDQRLHPRDKDRYAKRIVDIMKKYVYPGFPK